MIKKSITSNIEQQKIAQYEAEILRLQTENELLHKESSQIRHSVAQISHDISNYAGMSQLVEIMSENCKNALRGTNSPSRTVQEVHSDLQAIKTTLDDMFTFSRGELQDIVSKLRSHKTTQADVFEPFRVYKELSDLVDLYNHSISLDRDLVFHFDKSSLDSDPMLFGNRLLTKAIYVDILSNALKYTPNGVINIAYVINQTSHDSALVHTIISDTGIGVPENKLESIFKGEQVNKPVSDDYNSTGLGLQAVRNRVTRLGGDVYAKQNTPRGLQMHVKIPYKIHDSSKIGSNSVE